jgi:hypothetical protein
MHIPSKRKIFEGINKNRKKVNESDKETPNGIQKYA